VFKRRDEPDLAWDDRTLILDALMRIGAKLEDIEALLLEDGNGEDRERS
jgi:hypothetical protein